jgi:hypothetical protein
VSDSGDSEPVPKLPRGRGLKFSGVELFRIAITLALLIALVVLTRPCSHAVSTFVLGFDGSAAKPQPAPAGSNAIGSDLIPLRGLDEAQLKATVERAQHRRPAKAAEGSAGSAAGSAGSAAQP